MERLVFDFFGFMWTCIAINFLQIIFVIVALFGVCQDRAKIVVAVSIIDSVISLLSCLRPKNCSDLISMSALFWIESLKLQLVQ